MRVIVATVSAAAAILLSWGAMAQAPVETVKLQRMKYSELTEIVRQMRGKVVIVDCWADFCPPCKREFPKLVTLHQRYSAQGLSAVSVALDDPHEPGSTQRVKLFLDRNKAAFTNIILDERPEVWQNKFRIDGPPYIAVFNRKGELAQKFVDDQVDYAAIEKLAAGLLKE